MKCLKCDSKNVKTHKEGFIKNANRSMWNVLFPIRLLFASNRTPKKLYVCKDCGFSWESR